MLVEFQGFDKQEFIKNSAQLDFTRVAINNRFYAKIGCENIQLLVKFKSNNRLKIKFLSAHGNDCVEKTGLASSFKKTLPEMKKYEVSGHFLTLSDEKGTRMKFIASDWD